MSTPAPEPRGVCYFPYGAQAEAQYTPCNPGAAVSACCYSNELCFGNQLCLTEDGRMFRETCTDQNWGSGCPDFSSICSSDSSSDYTRLYPCLTEGGTGGYTCEPDGDCIFGEVSNNFTYVPREQQVRQYMENVGIDTSDNPSDNGSVMETVTTTATATSTPTDLPNIGYGPRAMVGVGVGVGAPLALALVGAIILLFRQKKKIKEMSNGPYHNSQLGTELGSPISGSGQNGSEKPVYSRL